ncbi:hypothetical protein MNBD_GAMMA03-412 [hydrothermal vent metagenome]|uniref:SPOR domain-containing protein n=1 Tax=hydrothermal vent metagenome TaxID=652676 RepID=A0A3B0WAG8_9ZZZZ
MARDYRHGHRHKQAFQRKSQREEAPTRGQRSGAIVWGAGILVSIVLLVGFFVVNHFISQGAKSSSFELKNIFQSTESVQKKTDVSTEQESKLTPEPKPELKSSKVMVNEVVIPEDGDEKSVKYSAQNHYSFYQGLSQTEVVVEAELISVALSQPYYIQAGSFGSEKLAKQEQKRLKKHGQQLTVSGLTRDGRTYYRLRVGPFSDRLRMNKRRNELRKLGVDTLLIKAPK